MVITAPPGPFTRAEVARRAWQAVSEADVDALARASTDNIVGHAAGRGPRSGDYRGRREVLDYLASLGDATERFDLDLEDVLVGDALTAIVLGLKGRREGREVETGSILLLRFEGVRVAEVWAVPRDQIAIDEFWS